MVEVKVWKCDGCGRLVEKSTEIYVVNLKSLGARFEYDSYEYNTIELHFCAICARNLLETLKKIANK